MRREVKLRGANRKKAAKAKQTKQSRIRKTGERKRRKGTSYRGGELSRRGGEGVPPSKFDWTDGPASASRVVTWLVHAPSRKGASSQNGRGVRGGRWCQ